ncbi:MAG TPA: hypothetical protein V6C58_14840 [Allocoleopsis sp.]
MNSKRKGQIAGQIFIYIMAVIVIGAIAIIGYSAIDKVLNKSCDAEKAVFKTNLEELIEKYTSFGSVNKKTIRAPCEYDTICFVDSSITSFDTPKILKDNFICANRLISDSVKSGSETNIFVKSNDKTIPIGYSQLVSLTDADKNKCLCIPAKNGNFYVTFTGKGTSAEIVATQ